ncbi:MAG: hypothetical protein MMC23_003130 [Stictis urceolatum]|nr:hypothetical protein [Stictis urceolata]
MPDVEDLPVQPKAEQHSREPSLSSIASSPGAERDGDLDGPSTPPANVPVQKRKGGRKPVGKIYATSEERKQRNRQAQAAFRERRTEYIKQLETTIKQQDETLQSLQQSHRSAADECLMLRYKNSLLERILLEKGVDVQNELKKKEIPIPGKLPVSLQQQTPIQRSLGRHLCRPGSGHQAILQKAGPSALSNHSPQLQPTPPSQPGSPTTARSPTYAMSGSMNPPPHGYKPEPRIQPNLRAAPGPGVSSPTIVPSLQPIAPNPNQQPGSAGHRPSHWPSPYQTHISQLEQEYDAPADMMDEEAEEAMPSGPGPYPQPFHQSYTHGHDPNHQQFAATQPQAAQSSQAGGFQQVGGQYIDPFDPMLDADPFGLTASMHFPTQFSFQESSMRK